MSKDIVTDTKKMTLFLLLDAGWLSVEELCPNFTRVQTQGTIISCLVLLSVLY